MRLVARPLSEGIERFVQVRGVSGLTIGELRRTTRCRLKDDQTHVGWRLLFLYPGDKEHHYSDHCSRAWRPFLLAEAAGKKRSTQIKETTGTSFHESARHAFADGFLPEGSDQTDAAVSAGRDAQTQAHSHATQANTHAEAQPSVKLIGALSGSSYDLVISAMRPWMNLRTRQQS